jgi:alpha-L-fucosidase 2
LPVPASSQRIKYLAALAAFFLLLFSLRASNLTLWYDQPGTGNMTQGLLIGNGRMGAIIPGGVATDTLILNEDSLWAGTANLSGGYNLGANGSFGDYEMFGSLVLNLPAHTNATGYVRALDIGTGIATVDYTNNGVEFHRELICSAPDQVLAIQLTASANAAYTGSLQLNDAHGTTTTSTANGLMFSGALANGEQYEAQLVVTNHGGTLGLGGGVVNFTNCNSLTILVALGTSYVMNDSLNYQGNNPHTNVLAQVTAAAAKGFATLETAHTNDFTALFNRVSLWLGNPPPGRTNLPTDQRITANAAADDDPGMEQLMFQYGRYLMISSSRGGVPMNLQGLWNDNNNPSYADWGDDYHSDINLEMMYWEAEVANLPECFLPFSNWLQSQIPAWRYVTTNTSSSVNNGGYGGGFGGTNGWTTRTSHNLYGGEGWNWIQSGNAWYCLQLWEHYAFSGDTNYLVSVYPILKETCQFWQQHLQLLGPNTNGLAVTTLVATNGWSPEHGPWENGVSFDQELIWDVFNNYQQACALLNTDAVYSVTISNLQANLLVPGIGPWGELREWLYYPDIEPPNPGYDHRHTMHLLGVYPGHQFTPDQTPALMAAAKVGLLARGDTGDSSAEWAHAWRISLFARMLDPVDAHHKLALFCGTIYPNLIGNLGGIAQWDGSCGVTAGIAEMLLQSHEGRITLLPALPTNWPAGSVTGLRARGGFTVDMTWTNGWLTAAAIHSANGTNCAVQYGSETIQTNVPPGGSVQFTPQIPPNTPSDLFAHPGSGEVSVGWGAAPGATSYNLKSSTTDGNYAIVTNLTATSFVNTGLVNGTTYFFVVSATNAYGESSNSISVSATPAASYATNFYWTGGVNANWDTATANWQTNAMTAVFQDGGTVVFDDSALGNTAVNLPAPRAPASIIVNNASQTYSISGSAISGPGSLTKLNSGTLTLNAANTFSGGVTNRAGTLTLGNAAALGRGPLTLNGGTLNNLGLYTLSNNVIVAGSGSAIQLGSANNLTLMGGLSGNGTLLLGNDANGQTVFLLVTNTMTGGTISLANNSTCVRFASPLAGNPGVDWVFNNTTANRETLDFASGTISFGSLSGAGVIQGNVNGPMNVTLSVGGDNNSTIFSGLIHDNLWGTGPVGLTKVGSGTLTLTGANDYNGATTISNGELLVSTAFAGGGGVAVNSGAALGLTNASLASAQIGNLTLAAGAVLEFQGVASTTTPLAAVGNVSVGGTCTLKITGGGGLVAGSSFPLLSYAGTFGGSFTNLQLQMPYGWRGTLVNSGSQISLTKVAVVSLTPPLLSASISGQQCQLLWPGDHIGWRVQAQTNSLSQTGWVNVAGNWVGLTNQLLLPISEGNGSVFYRLVYP